MASSNGYDDAEFASQFAAHFRDREKKVGRFNIAVFGKTGAGKSTLINAVFGEKVARTGIGEPVTKTQTMYVHKSNCLGLFDAPGLEIGQDGDKILSDLRKIVETQRGKPLAEQLHVVWYCVRATDLRFEDVEAEFIRAVDNMGIPVMLVMTRVPVRDGKPHPDAQTFAEEIAKRALPVKGGSIFLTMAEPDSFYGQQSHGLKGLLDATFRVAPEGVRTALNTAQTIDMERKRQEALRIVAAAAAAAAAAGASPIPFSDAVVLAPIQLGMMAKVAHIFGIPMDTASMAGVAATTLAAGGGRALAGGLLKMVPGVGTLLGGFINASVATVITSAMGGAWMAVCQQMALGKLGDLESGLDTALIRELFTSEFKKRFRGSLPGTG